MATVMKPKMNFQEAYNQVSGEAYSFKQDGFYYDIEGIIFVDEELQPGSTACKEEYLANRKKFDEQVKQKRLIADASPETQKMFKEMKDMATSQQEQIDELKRIVSGLKVNDIAKQVLESLTDGEEVKIPVKTEGAAETKIPDPDAGESAENLTSQLTGDKAQVNNEISDDKGFNFLGWVSGEGDVHHSTAIAAYNNRFKLEGKDKATKVAQVVEGLIAHGIIDSETADKSPLMN